MMTVYNKKGESRNIVFRLARAEDVPRIIALLKKQHGTGYYPEMYDEAYVRNLIETGKLQVAAAEAEDGSLAGFIGANRADAFDGSIRFGMLLISPPWRNFGLGKIIHRFLLDMIPPKVYTAIYGYCMTLDTTSQVICQELGYRMTGLLPNGQFNDLRAEFLAGRPLPVKDTLLVVNIPQKKKDAGRLYLPPGHTDFIIDIYDKLGVTCTIEKKPAVPRQSPLQSIDTLSIYTIKQVEEHRYCELILQKTGDDFNEVLVKLLRQYGGLENQSFTVFVNLNDPRCPQACRLLEEAGFFFTGLHPLSGACEYLLMHYSPSLPVPFDRVAVVPEFEESFDYIRHLYQEVSHGHAH
jgi:GNAT superfamily N-acetyltransferase